MFRRLRDPEATVSIVVDDVAVVAAAQDTVAAALLAAGIGTFRRLPWSGSPRGPFCGMGVCFDCLVTVDGEAGVQACLTPVRDGMSILTGGSRSGPSPEADG